MAPTRVIVEVDGGARGNPGPAGYGAVVRDVRTGDVLVERYRSLGITTNNVAEYQGLIAGLTAAAELGAREVDVRMDSKLVVEQMSGRWQIKHPGLRPLAAKVAALARGFTVVRFEWIPRERNRLADALANRAMDEATGAQSTGREHSRPGRPKAEAQTPGGQEAEPAVWEPPTAPPTRLILVRHAVTDMTAQRRYSGRRDVPLSADGLAQAQTTAPRVAGLAGPGAAVLSSPLLRCTATAAPIAAKLGGVPVATDDDLVECDFGDWDGLTFAEVGERWPQEHAAWLASSAVAPPGGESMQAVAARAGRFVERLRQSRSARTIVVVSHVSPIKLMLRDALAAGDALLHRLYLDPAGISIVDMWPDSEIAVRAVNDTAHLG